MGEILRFNPRRDIPVAEGGHQTFDGKEGKNSKEAANYEKFVEYLDNLDLSGALKTEKEDEDGVLMPVDLAELNLDSLKTVDERVVMRVVKEGLVAANLRSGLSEDADTDRALNNYLQIMRFGRSVVKPPGISINDEAWSKRLDQKMEEIRGKKRSLLSEKLGESAVEKIQELFDYVKEGWASDVWQEELKKIKGDVKPSKQLMSPEHFIGSAKTVRRMSINGVSITVDLKSERDLKEAEDAYRSGQNVGNINKSSNQDWNTVGKLQREQEDDVHHQQALATMEFLRGKVRKFLVKQAIRTV